MTSGLTCRQVEADLGVGLSTLNKWVQKHRHDDLMAGHHDDVEKEIARLRKENRVLKEALMLNHPTLDQLKALKLDAMAEAFGELETPDATANLSHAE